MLIFIKKFIHFFFSPPLPNWNEYNATESFDASNNVFSESKWNVEIVIRKHLLGSCMMLWSNLSKICRGFRGWKFVFLVFFPSRWFEPVDFYVAQSTDCRV